MIAPNRDQLARMTGGDQRLIRFFEELAAASVLSYGEVTASVDLLADAFAENRLVQVNSASPVVLTIRAGMRPTQVATVARIGAGAVTFAAGPGVTINSEAGELSIAARYGTAIVWPLPTPDRYLVTGRIA